MSFLIAEAALLAVWNVLQGPIESSNSCSLLSSSKTGNLRASSRLFKERSSAGHVIARLQSCNLNKGHWRIIGGSKSGDREVVCDKIACRAMETAGRVVIALDYSDCMATRYIVMLEPAAGTGMRKQINSIPVSIN